MRQPFAFVIFVASVVAKARRQSCSQLLIDDWSSESRLNSLNQNAMRLPSGDDGSMRSMVVANNSVTLTPKDQDSHLSIKFDCLAAERIYGGVAMRIKAPAGTTLRVSMSSSNKCSDRTGEDRTQVLTSKDLSWEFNGEEQLYNIGFNFFKGIDMNRITELRILGLHSAITLGPMSAYCGSVVKEWVASKPVLDAPMKTVRAAPGNGPAMLIDDFAVQETNALGNWHGADDGMKLTYGNKQLTLSTSDPDLSFYTALSPTCVDLRASDDSFLHIAYSGHTAFTVSLLQHNSKCDESIAPYPETWDSIEASRYASGSDIYIPLSHFNIDKSRVVSVSLKGFYKPDPISIRTIEIVPSIPQGIRIPEKLPTGQLIFSCKRPNSFAFAIDDGEPQYAQQVMKIIRDAGIKVTFFTVGSPLLDPSTNLTNVYREMLAEGHQIAMHSFTHPKMEGLADYAAIDSEYTQNIAAMAKQFNGLSTTYFRPPYGTEGARMRQRLAAALGTAEPYIVNWSIDVQDWIWGESKTPEKQLDAFRQDVAKGGDLVVMHYLYKSTVSYLPEFIKIAKATGKQLMRVDQCMMDPNAPPL